MTGSSFVLLSSLSFAKESLRSFRQDLEKRLSSLCSHSDALTSYDFLKAGIFDSQALLFSSKDPFAKDSLPKIPGYHGETSVLCGERRSLILLTRSPEALEIQIDEFSIPSSLNGLCSSILLNFANATQGHSQTISISEKIKIPQENGVLSLSCFPKDNPRLGKETWFLVPTGEGPNDLPPGAEYLELNENPEIQMQAWLNHLRKQEGLHILDNKNPKLSKLLHLLKENDSIEHDRILNKRVREFAEKEHLTLLGENRAQGGSLQELAWLLWNSPRHRDLLLNKKAEFSNVHIDFTKKTWFLLWLFAMKKERSGV